MLLLLHDNIYIYIYILVSYLVSKLFGTSIPTSFKIYIVEMFTLVD